MSDDDIYTPRVTLLVKLGSIAVHADEFTSDEGLPVDGSAIRSGLEDSEVKEWIKAMTKLGLLPVQRNQKEN